MAFYTLTVEGVERPISGQATTLRLAIPPALRDRFAFWPGQHLVFRWNIEGREVRRTYSIHSDAAQPAECLEVTVKRVQGGRVSNFIGDRLKPGMTVEVMPPQGRFYVRPQPEAYRTFFLFAAGSGITPIYAIARAILSAEPRSFVRLFYGNRNLSSALFCDALDALQAKHGARRFAWTHTLSAPYSDWHAVLGWSGRKGIIDRAAVEWFIQEHPPPAQDTQYWICGPGSMNADVRAALIELGVPRALVHVEHFGAALAEEAVSGPEGVAAQARVRIDGHDHSVPIARGQTLLDALRARGLHPPFSCTSGVCGTCVARMTEGRAHMRHNMALEDALTEQGYVLTCQALPLSPKLALVFSE